MIKQTLFFTTPVSLSLKYNQIVIHFDDAGETVTRAIEDVGVVIVENQMARFTVPLLNPSPKTMSRWYSAMVSQCLVQC